MRKILLTIVTLSSIATVAAESITQRVYDIGSRSDITGTLFNRDVMGVGNMGILMQNNFQYGTARSMAMAGAMTSLGGDGSSLMINPAGLAMSRHNDLTITPMLTIQSYETDGVQGSGRVPFSMSNVSTAINMYESSSSKLVCVNFGFGYNKIADFNYNYSASASGQTSSVANIFSRQLTGYGITLSEVYGEQNPNWSSIPSNIWGAALGYKGGMTFQKWGEEPNKYPNDGENITYSTWPIWSSTWLEEGAVVDQSYTMESEGSVGEYDFSFAANLDNKLYVGVTFGMQDIYQRLDLLYSESYPENVQGDMYAALNSAYYNQSVINDGSGFNIKVGATYRPIEALRIGVAYHSPTWYSMRRQYQASVGSTATKRDSGFILDEVDYTGSVISDSPIINDYGSEKWHFRSASRLLMGASYTFAQRALVSFDYQLDWCGNMKMTEVPYSVDESLYSSLSSTYQTVNVYRVGAEYKVTPQVALRGGYGSSSSMVREGIESQLALLGSPVTTDINYYSAGVGYAFNSLVSIDLTYMFQSTQYCEYSLFYSEIELPDSVITAAEALGIDDTSTFDTSKSRSESFSTRLKQHNIALSLVVRM